MIAFEKQFFSTYEGWDEVDVVCVQFYEAVSRIPIGDFPIGTKFNCATFDFRNSQLFLLTSETDSDGVENVTEHVFNLTVSAVEREES